MAIQIYEIPPPVLELSLASDGDLPAGTTYYFIGFYRLGGGYYGNSAGKASEEYSITTTEANQRIHVKWKYWDETAGAYVYGIPSYMDGLNERDGIVFKWDYYSMLDGNGKPYKWCNLNDPAISSEFQDWQYGHHRWTINYGSNGHVGSEYYFHSANLYETYYGTHNHSELAWQYDRYNVYTNLNMEASDLIIVIDGEGNTRDDLFTALIASGYFDRFELHNDRLAYDATYVSLLLLKGTFYGTGELSLEYVHLSFLTGHNRNDNVTFTKCNIHMAPLCFSYWINLRGNYIDSQLLHGGNAIPLTYIGTTSRFRPMYDGGFSTYGSYDGITFLASGGGTQFRYPYTGLYCKDVVFENTYLSVTAQGGSSHDYIMYLENIVIDSYTYLDILHANIKWVAGLSFKDRLVFNGLTVTDRDDGIAIIQFNTPAGGDCESIYEVNQGLSLKVVGPAGEPIIGATVEITDGRGHVYTLTTDENGGISEFIECYTVEYDVNDADGNGYNSKTSIYNTFDMVIRAQGYAVYTTRFTLTESVEWEVSLNPPTYFERALIGQIEVVEIGGSIEASEITGQVVQQEISGTAEIEEMKGDVETPQISGTI